MGSSGSKPANDDALSLCKERVQYIKQAIEYRNALSADHLSYIKSLRGVGAALRRYVEMDLPVDSSISISEVDKSPSHSSYASPSPSRFIENVASPLHGASPWTPPSAKVSYMRATGSTAVTITIDPSAVEFVEQESTSPSFLIPPPPLPPELCSSWDFFDPTDAVSSSTSRNTDNGLSLNFNRLKGLRQLREAEVVPLIEEEMNKSEEINGEHESTAAVVKQDDKSDNASVDTLVRNSSKMPVQKTDTEAGIAKELGTEKEDASDFITHRAKDFVSSMKDIELKFIRAAESGNEVSRMLETKKIKLSVSANTSGKPSPSKFISTFDRVRVCCNGEAFLNQENAQHITNVITWNRTISSVSSSSRSPLTRVIKDDGVDNSEYVEQFSMISGSHSSTLDRLLAWERKLHDEIKASQYIRKAYDQKCSLLRRQFARGLNAETIDKTRAVVKDLHSRVCVAIQAVDAISKRIEKIRDEELQPQLVELIQGLIRMWKAMLECHHAQFITITLAYHVRSSPVTQQPEHRRQLLMHLRDEIDCFATSFTKWVFDQTCYVESLNKWLQKCVLQPQERRRGRRKVSFPPRNALSPPIFVLCNDWLNGMKSLPSEELRESVKGVMSLLRGLLEQQTEESVMKSESQECGILESNEQEGNRGSMVGLDSLQSGLTKVLDCLTKFSEASLKLYDELKQGYEMARIAYKMVASDHTTMV